jgi:rhodanese-related sulfurtransferase
LDAQLGISVFGRVLMQLFLEFVGQQWILVAALIMCLALLLRHESAKGGPSLSPQQLINMVNQQQAVVVDLRDTKEFAGGHIVDAINIPQAKLVERKVELDSYRQQPLILVDKMGQHTGAAGKQLSADGFEQVSRLSGGMMEWKSQQLPLVTQ